MRLFLSHATESKGLVERITAGLPAHVDRWLDNEQMAAGDPLSRRIEDAIAEACDYMVVFLDSAALSRKWVPREIAWGIEREQSLGRTFLLPVLLEDVRERLRELPELDSRLYLLALDHSPPGIANAMESLSKQLFFQASQLIETLRSTDRRSLLDAFSRELTAYKQAAFQWRASLGNSLEVLTTNADAYEHVRESVRLYNEASDPFMAHLASHRDRITAAWSRYRGLCDDVRALAARIEQIYRGEMFALNRIHEIVHALMITQPPQRPAADDQARREAVLTAAGNALDDLSRHATQVIASLEREIS